MSGARLSIDAARRAVVRAFELHGLPPPPTVEPGDVFIVQVVAVRGYHPSIPAAWVDDIKLAIALVRTEA